MHDSIVHVHKKRNADLSTWLGNCWMINLNDPLPELERKEATILSAAMASAHLTVSGTRSARRASC